VLRTQAGEPFVNRVIVYSRDEHRQADMAETYAAEAKVDRFVCFIGDVRDRRRFRNASSGNRRRVAGQIQSHSR